MLLCESCNHFSYFRIIHMVDMWKQMMCNVIVERPHKEADKPVITRHIICCRQLVPEPAIGHYAVFIRQRKLTLRCGMRREQHHQRCNAGSEHHNYESYKHLYPANVKH